MGTEADLTLQWMIAGLPDHLGRLEEEGWGDGEAEGLRGPEVDDKLEGRGLLHRQLGGGGSLEDLIHVGGGAAEEVGQVHAVGHQASSLHKFSPVEARREPEPGRRVEDLGDVDREEGVSSKVERLGVFPGGRGEGTRELVGPPDLQRLRVYAQPAAGLLRRVPLQDHGGVRRIPEHGHTREPGHELGEQLEPFRAELRGQNRQARDVAAWPRQAGDEARPNRIATGRHDDGNGRGRLLGRLDCRSRPGDEDIHREADQLSGELGETVRRRLAVLKGEVLALAVAQRAQPLLEGLEVAGGSGSIGGEGREEADAERLPRRPRLSHERCDEETERKDDEESDWATQHERVLRKIQQDHKPAGRWVRV